MPSDALARPRKPSHDFTSPRKPSRSQALASTHTPSQAFKHPRTPSHNHAHPRKPSHALTFPQPHFTPSFRQPYGLFKYTKNWGCVFYPNPELKKVELGPFEFLKPSNNMTVRFFDISSRLTFISFFSKKAWKALQNRFFSLYSSFKILKIKKKILTFSNPFNGFQLKIKKGKWNKFHQQHCTSCF